MSRFWPGSLALSLLPIFAVIGTLSLRTVHQDRTQTKVTALEFYQSPSPSTDTIHVTQLESLLETIKAYDRRAAKAGMGPPSHAGLADGYRLIVRETTPQCILRAGLPLDIH